MRRLEARSVQFDMLAPFTYADAITAGISPSSLRGANFRRIFRGVYVHCSVPYHPLVRVRAALLIHPPDAFASHLSAATVHGIAVPVLPDEHVSVFEERDRRRRAGIRNHVTPPGTPVTVRKGIRVSAPDQTFVELAGLLHLVDLVVAGDDLVRLERPRRRACGASARAPETPMPPWRGELLPGSVAVWTRRWRPGCECFSSSRGFPSRA